ncbi:embryonal Fyn-associated substrate isoform X2 [Denticeps clupeoides]|uniref:SH3 domain-containing protein n=1 Tax=Denticeps clupeoides TaxID=299321 RepID=A0AAY4A0I7_9TELE|nr:embryonal Fyn-associated substrate-like isoform X2 [Denticeps clupeoides]
MRRCLVQRRPRETNPVLGARPPVHPATRDTKESAADGRRPVNVGRGPDIKTGEVGNVAVEVLSSMSLSTVLAKALFDNAAESPEELAFRKGDILMVLEQEQSGGPGWWLCSLHGRQGIAPANRLRLLQTAAGASPDVRRAQCADSPGRVNPLPQEDGVYLSPPSLAEGVYQSPGTTPTTRPGELRQAEATRPRSHSSSGTRPRPDWDGVMGGRPRSPSLRGRGDEAAALYQTPSSPAPATAQYHRPQGAVSSDSLYLTPPAVARSASVASESPGEATYLVPRDVSGVGHSEGCYLIPRVPVASVHSEDLYQTPTGGVVLPAAGRPNSPSAATPSQPSMGQEIPGMYQTPTPPGGVPRTPQNERKLHNTPPPSASGNHKQLPPTAKGSPRPQLKSVAKDPANLGAPSTPPVGRGKPRGSPLLVRTGHPVPGSPSFVRKPPPPAPPVRGVTRKDPPTPAPKPVLQAALVPPLQLRDEAQRHVEETKKEATLQEEERRKNSKVQMEGDGKDHVDQVYDTPPTNRWQHAALSASCEEDESIYNTPRTLQLHVDQESEIYDVPTLALNPAAESHQQQQQQQLTYSVPASLALAAEEEEEDVYSVPSLPGLPLAAGEPEETSGQALVYSVPSPDKSETDRARHSNPSLEESEPDGGIYDMPAISLDVPASSYIRRLSVSSTGSGDVQWKTSLSALVQSALSSATSASAKELAASLAEILSAWKAGQAGDAPPPLQQAWTRVSDVLPALAVCGNAPPSEALLAMVQRALEESSLLLQSQTRPRLPSQESLSRRPLPALPVAEVKPLGSGMGSRKGSWIQERPLPPPPPPAFPLPPASLPPSVGRSEDEEEELGNEYAGIGLTPAPPSLPVGDIVGYVKLQLSPSPPLPVSLSLEDSELLSFYSSQSLSHLSCLADAIDALFTSVQGNQPPRVFVSRGKSLIVTAHKLVFIGDTLSRLLSSPDLRAKVTTSGGRLCQALKSVVVATKGAAQNYPSVPATQEMVDRVAELSQHAAGFSGLLQRLAEIS